MTFTVNQGSTCVLLACLLSILQLFLLYDYRGPPCSILDKVVIFGEINLN